jgi:hypothetical protein
MGIQLPATISGAKLAWTLIAIVGVVFTSMNWWDALRDLKTLRRSGKNGVLFATATGELTEQTLLWVALFTDLVAGLLSLISPTGAEPEGGPTPFALFGPPLFLIGAVALIYLSFSRQRRRRAIIRALRLPRGEAALVGTLK